MQPDNPNSSSDKKTWSGRFSEPVADLVKRYSASVGFDQRLAEFDIQGSLAHARMLHACGVLSAEDLTDIERGLDQISEEIADGEFEWSIDYEDVHLNVEHQNSTHGLRSESSLQLGEPRWIAQFHIDTIDVLFSVRGDNEQLMLVALQNFKMHYFYKTQAEFDFPGLTAGNWAI